MLKSWKGDCENDIARFKRYLKRIESTNRIPLFRSGQVPALPYIVYYADEDVAFYADDIVYHEGYAVTIEVYTEYKDIELEKRVKQLLNDNQLPYESYESFLDSEGMYLKAYEIDI